MRFTHLISQNVTLKFLVVLAFTAILPSCKESSKDQTDIASGRAADIRVFYPPFLADSIQDLFASTLFSVDSNLVRFEENRPANDPQYYESAFNFELHPFSQMEEIDPASNGVFQQHTLIWAIDPLSNLSDCERLSAQGNSAFMDTVIEAVQCTWLKDVWSKQQVVLWIHDTHSAGENFSLGWLKKHQAILCGITKAIETGEFNHSKHNPTAVIEQNAYSDSISQLLAGKYNLQLCLNATLKLVQATADFVWLRNENSQFHSNFMVNIFPATESSMSLDSVVALRNHFTKKYLKTAEGTWVEISSSGIFPTRLKKSNHNGNPEYYLTGWYTELNTDRRGPFIRKIVLDKKNKRWVAFDGFLFAPNQPRVSLMRELEIMVNHSFIK